MQFLVLYPKRIERYDMDEIKQIFDQLRRDVATATTTEQRSMVIDRAELMTQSLLLRRGGQDIVKVKRSVN